MAKPVSSNTISLLHARPKRYQVTTTGAIFPDYSRSVVRFAVAQAFRVSARQARKWVDTPHVLKRNLTWKQAHTLAENFAELGVRCVVEPVGNKKARDLPANPTAGTPSTALASVTPLPLKAASSATAKVNSVTRPKPSQSPQKNVAKVSPIRPVAAPVSSKSQGATVKPSLPTQPVVDTIQGPSQRSNSRHNPPAPSAKRIATEHTDQQANKPFAQSVPKPGDITADIVNAKHAVEEKPQLEPDTTANAETVRECDTPASQTRPEQQPIVCRQCDLEQDAVEFCRDCGARLLLRPLPLRAGQRVTLPLATETTVEEPEVDVETPPSKNRTTFDLIRKTPSLIAISFFMGVCTTFIWQSSTSTIRTVLGIFVWMLFAAGGFAFAQLGLRWRGAAIGGTAVLVTLTGLTVLFHNPGKNTADLISNRSVAPFNRMGAAAAGNATAGDGERTTAWRQVLSGSPANIAPQPGASRIGLSKTAMATQAATGAAVDAMTVDMDVYKKIYADELRFAKAFAESPKNNDQAVREFMVFYGYSEFSEPKLVTNDELSHFKLFTAPELEKMAANNPSFEEWFSTVAN